MFNIHKTIVHGDLDVEDDADADGVDGGGVSFSPAIPVPEASVCVSDGA